jgi:hypothetical protein
LSKFACDVELRIPSDFVYLRSVRAFIRELAENIGFCPEKVRNIEIATDEIFSNAVEHGSNKVWSDINNSKVKIGTERGHGLLLAHLLTDEMRMESNSLGGLDVQLLWFIGRESLCCTNTNRVLCEPQVCLNSTE